MSAGKPYDVDLAYTHDVGYGDFARRAAPHLLERISRTGEASDLVVDLGCGSGIWAQALAEAGYRVIGVDLSTEMIEIARRRAPAATFQVGSLVDFAIPSCRAVTAMSEVFNYLLDPANSLATLRRVAGRVFDALLPGGVFIFDVAEPGRSAGMTRNFREGEDWACLVEYQHDAAREQLTRRIVTFRKIGESFRRSEETHRQQLYARAAIVELLTSAGFQVEILLGYGETQFPAGLVGFAASKAGPSE